MVAVHMSDSEELSAIIQLPPDFPYVDLINVGSILKSEQLLVPGYVPPPVGVYSPESYLFEARLQGFEFWILPDRNLVSRIARVGMGERIGPDRRAAAALMAFAQCLNVNFDPSIAFHELAHRKGNQVAHEELQSFRAADEARPQEWIDVALERSKRLSPPARLPAIEKHNLARPLRRWRRNYVIALKIAELELLGTGSRLDRALRLLDWMTSDFIFGGPAFVLSTLYFSRSSPRKGLLKQLRSPIRERAIDGVRNAAWDLTYISDFVRRVNEQGLGRRRYLLASADRGLARVASLLFQFDGKEDDAEKLAGRLQTWWPFEEALTLSQSCVEALRCINEPEWRSTPLRNDISSLIAEGERRLIDWA